MTSTSGSTRRPASDRSAWRPSTTTFVSSSRGPPHLAAPGPSRAPAWMRVGFALYKRLRDLGFEFLRQGESAEGSTVLEVHPHACFAALLGRRARGQGPL